MREQHYVGQPDSEREAPTEHASGKGSPSARARIRRHPERAVAERAEEILTAGRVAHVAYAIDGQPFVLPFTYYFEQGRLYLHGAPASRTLHALASGTPVCVEVTLLDGLVASRTAKSHSVNYRSVVVFGRAVEVTDLQAKRTIFERMTRRYFAEREVGHDYAPARDGDLRSSRLLAIQIEEMSAKTRSGPALGPHDAEEGAPGTSYVVLLPEVDG